MQKSKQLRRAAKRRHNVYQHPTPKSARAASRRRSKARRAKRAGA